MAAVERGPMLHAAVNFSSRPLVSDDGREWRALAGWHRHKIVPYRHRADIVHCPRAGGARRRHVEAALVP